MKTAQGRAETSVKEKNWAWDNAKKRKKILKISALFLAGVVFSGAQVAGRLSPFGVSAFAATSGGYAVFAFLGAGTGYLISAASVRYIAELIVLAAIKWAFAAFFETERKWALPTAAGAVNLAVGSVTLLIKEATFYDIFLMFSESVICAGGTYFINSVFSVVKKGGSLKKSENVVSLSVCAALLLISLSKIVVGVVSVGHIIAVYCIMTMSYSLGTLGGACAGLAVGAALSVSAADGGFLAMALGVGGMLSGLFSKISRYAPTVAFMLCIALAVSTSGADTDQLYFLYETLTASVLFLLTPEQLFSRLYYYFPPISSESEAYPNKYLAARLNFVSQTVQETSQAICEMSERYSKKTGADVGEVFSAAADSVCRRCANTLNCWDSGYIDTMDCFNHMIPALRRAGKIEDSAVPERLRSRCIKIKQLVSEINSGYRKKCEYSRVADRCRQVKEVMTGQLGGVSRLLCEMSQELSLTMCDRESEGRVSSELIKAGVKVMDVSCPVDRLGRKSVEFYLPVGDAEKLDENDMEACISEILSTPMQRGAMTKTKDVMRMSFSQSTPYSVETASFQKSAAEGEICGDSFVCTALSGGFSAVILSDGMGRGKSAAIDSKITVSMVSRFLSLGFTPENTVSLVNSALMLKSEDETLSTLDAAIFDLYSGSVSIKKSGAAPSFLRRGKKITKIEIGSLPLGILGDSEVKVKGAELKLSKGDMVVMCSDGMCTLSDGEVERILRKSEGMSPSQIANALGESAEKLQEPLSRDDITVLVTRIC